MEHFREVQDGIFLLKSPFPPVWSGVTLVRGEELCLIDSGASADVVDGVIRPALAELGLGLGDIDWLVSTHCHGDHIGGVAALLARWPATPVYAPHDDRIPLASHRVADGDVLVLGDWRFRVLAVPGHTRSHVAYHGEGLLFCGDTLFSLGCGRLFEGTAAQMHASLARLAALPGETRVCCAHEYTQGNAAFALAVDPGNRALQARAGEIRGLRALGQPTLPARLDEERACNPFLRCADPAVRTSAERHAGRPLADAAQVFGALRAWKDGFRA